MSRGLAALAVIGALAGVTGAEPVQVGSETWQHEALAEGDVFARADGTRIELAAASLPCSQQLRTVELPRPEWLPPTYWPVHDAIGNIMVLCIERALGPVAVTVKPPAGVSAGAELGPILDRIAELVAPPAETSLGPLRTSLPVMMARGDDLVIKLAPEATVGVGLVYRAEGSCAYDNALVVVKLGQVGSPEDFAAGYYPTVVHGDKAHYGCLDTREGYLSVVVSPGTGVAALADVLAEVRRAAYAKYGAPLTTDVDELVLPRTQQRVKARTGAGSWKVVAGDRFEVVGGDVLTSIFPLGFGHTMYSVGVREGACAPGTTPAPADVAGNLFPSVLGTVWVDTRAYKRAWRVWVCLPGAELSVFGPLASDAPPDATESSSIRALVVAVAQSYGIEEPVHRGGGGGSSRRGGVVAQAIAYLGVLSFAPEMGDRRSGGLVGVGARVAQAKGGLGAAFAFDCELGYGNGEMLGEVRTGLGLSAGRSTVVDAVLGASVGSIGPAAALDVYGEASVTLPFGRGLLWMGATHAIGVSGPDHSRVEMRVGIPTKKDDTGYMFGARYLRFGDTLADDGTTALGNGDAFLFTFGAGAMAHD